MVTMKKPTMVAHTVKIATIHGSGMGAVSSHVTRSTTGNSTRASSSSAGLRGLGLSGMAHQRVVGAVGGNLAQVYNAVDHGGENR